MTGAFLLCLAINVYFNSDGFRTRFVHKNTIRTDEKLITLKSAKETDIFEIMDIFFEYLQVKINFFVQIMTKRNNIQITDQASYEAYLKDLFVLATVTQGTLTKSIDEILLDKALSYGRAVDEAKSDVKRILNVRDAVSLLLKKAAETQYMDG